MCTENPSTSVVNFAFAGCAATLCLLPVQFAKNWSDNWQVSRLMFCFDRQRLIIRDPVCGQYFLHKWKAGVAGF